MTAVLRQLFGVSKPVIAMVHLRALPGRPRHDRAGGMRLITDAVRRDLRALQDAGVDGLLFCNEADLPYQLGVGPEATAAMAAVIGAVRAEISRPFGVNLVWDPAASLAVARATGASFVREVFTGAYESDLGVMRPDFGAIGAYRSEIGAQEVAIFANITPEFASSLGGRTIAQRARSAVYLGVDALLISGAITGEPTDLAQLRAAKAAVTSTGVTAVPVLANTGVTADTVADVLAVADGAIVGTALKAGGVTWNEVDPERAASLMAAARQARAEQAGESVVQT
jgi:membrane complex biogenesis BtpA family protein